MERIGSKEELERRKAENPLLLVQFGGASCAPCTAIEGKLDRFLAEHPRLGGGYVSLDEHPELGAELGIFTVPAVLVYAEGRLTVRESGCFSLESLLGRVLRYIGLME